MRQKQRVLHNQGLKYTLVRLQGLTSRWQQAPDLPDQRGRIGKAALQGARMAAELLVIPGQWVFAQQSAPLFLPASPHPPHPTPLLRSPVTALPVTQTPSARGETSNLAPIMQADLFAVNYSQEAERLQQGGGGGGGGGRRGRRDAPDAASPYFQSRFLGGKLFKPRPQNVSRGFLTTHPPFAFSA